MPTLQDILARMQDAQASDEELMQDSQVVPLTLNISKMQFAMVVAALMVYPSTIIQTASRSVERIETAQSFLEVQVKAGLVDPVVASMKIAQVEPGKDLIHNGLAKSVLMAENLLGPIVGQLIAQAEEIDPNLVDLAQREAEGAIHGISQHSH